MKSWKKAAALLLLLTMVLPMAVSCSNGAKKKEAKQFVLFDPAGESNYTLVRSENASGVIVDSAKQINRVMQEKFGKTFDIKSDWVKRGEEIPTDTPEILIGETNRPESAEAKKAIGDASYIIKAFENGRVAIIGLDDATTSSAVQYFIKTFVEGSADGKITLSSDFVFSPDASDKPVSKNSDGSYRIKFTGMPIVYAAKSEFTFMAGFAKAYATRASFACTDDSVKSQSTFELLLGKCERDEFVPSPKSLLFRDFYISVKDNKVSIDAISAYGFEAAFNFIDKAVEDGYVDIPAEGLLVEYDYGDTQLGKLMKNYENPYVEGAWPVAVAHRGDFSSISKYPENSIKAYTSCINNNVDIIETDLHETKDGHWVICHDATLKRTTSGSITYTSKSISAVTLEQIKSLTLKQGNGGDSARATTEKMPTLEEIIELGKDKVMFNIDKTVTLDTFQPVYDIFEQYDAVDSAMFKSSESASDVAKWFSKLIEEGRKLPLFAPMIYKDNSGKIAALKQFKGMASMTETSSDLPSTSNVADVVAAAKDANIRLMVLTLDSKPDGDETWKSHLAKGMTGIMTNYSLDFVKLYHKK